MLGGEQRNAYYEVGKQYMKPILRFLYSLEFRLDTVVLQYIPPNSTFPDEQDRRKAFRKIK